MVSYIYFIILCVISAMPIFISIKIIKLVELSTKDTIILTCILTLIIMLLVGSFRKNELVIPIIMLITIIYCYFNKINILMMIISFILAFIIGALVDTIQAFVLIKIFKHSKEFYLNNEYANLIMNINLFAFSCLFSYGVKFISEKVKLKINYITKYKKAGIIILINLVLSCILFYFITLIVRYYNVDGSIINYLTGICTIVFIVNLGTSYYIIRDTQKDFEVKVMEDELKNLNLYTSSLEEVNTEVRKFRHDYVNILSAMYEYIEDSNIEGLRGFFNDNIIPLNESLDKKNLRLGLLGKIKIPELKSLLAFKVIRAQELGISIHIDIMEDINEINMEMVDLCRSVGIIMDNAVEAASETENPEIKIGIINSVGTINIIVVNNYEGVPPKLYEITRNGYSTKAENRGMGLHTLGEIIKRYRFATLDTIIKDKEFVQNISIDK